MPIDSDIARCRDVTLAIDQVLHTTTSIGVPYAVRFATLAAVIASQNEGRQGAGLTGGQQQESLFRDMLTRTDRRFTETAPAEAPDADYYFDGLPLSHKTIGYNGTGDLALAWSKNGEGVRRDQFVSSMVILSVRNPAKAGPLKSQPQGVFVIPATFLSGSVVFSSNNKTDSLIKAHYIAAAMHYSREHDLFVPIAYNPSAGHGVRISIWESGASPIIPPLP